MSGEKYECYNTDTSGKFDGRRTEKALERFFKTIDSNHPDYSYLSDKLNRLLDGYGKKPKMNFALKVPRLI